MSMYHRLAVCLVTVGFFLGSIITSSFIYGQQGGGFQGNEKKKKEEKKAPVISKRKTNLDEGQQEALKTVGKMNNLLYGSTQTLKEDEIKLYVDKFYETLNGTHMPRRLEVEKLAKVMLGYLKGKKLQTLDVNELTELTAEVLGEDQLYVETKDIFYTDSKTILRRGLLGESEVNDVVTILEELLKNANRNEEKIKARELAKKREEEKAEKEAKKKAEAASKKASKSSKKGGGGFAGGKG